jgi:hypothetical protein
LKPIALTARPHEVFANKNPKIPTMAKVKTKEIGTPPGELKSNFVNLTSGFTKIVLALVKTSAHPLAIPKNDNEITKEGI